MLISFIRVALLYLLVLFAIRVLGKRQISEYQPFELVVTMMIADIAAQPLSDVNTPLLNGIIPIVVFIFLQTTISFVTYKNERLRKIICGKPEVLIEDGHINQKEFKEMLQEKAKQENGQSSKKQQTRTNSITISQEGRNR